MRLRQALHDLYSIAQRLFHRQRSLFDLLLECLAVVAGHGDEELPCLGLADFVDGADVGMVERAGCLCLGNEALFGNGVGEEVRREEFERDDAFELGVVGFVDDTHAAATELFEHPVMRDDTALEVVGICCRCWFWRLIDGIAQGRRHDLGEALEVPRGIFFVRQERVEFFAQRRVAGTGVVKERGPLGGGQGQRSLEKGF